MAVKSLSNNLEMANMIKTRRNELQLTIEEAANRAGVGTKTWSRYEAGEAIRRDKYKGVCKALNWVKFPDMDADDDFIDIEEYKQRETWSKYLEKKFGNIAAVSFVIGSDILLDHIDEDLNDLAEMPKGTHIGQLKTSFVEYLLPNQFLMNYNYDFLYALRAEVLLLRRIAKAGSEIVAHSVLDELILHIIVEESEFLIESDSKLNVDSDWKKWIYEILGDDDIDMLLYSDTYVSEDSCYHFNYWMDRQFYSD